MALALDDVPFAPRKADGQQYDWDEEIEWADHVVTPDLVEKYVDKKVEGELREVYEQANVDPFVGRYLTTAPGLAITDMRRLANTFSNKKALQKAFAEGMTDGILDMEAKTRTMLTNLWLAVSIAQEKLQEAQTRRLATIEAEAKVKVKTDAAARKKDQEDLEEYNQFYFSNLNFDFKLFSEFYYFPNYLLINREDEISHDMLTKCGLLYEKATGFIPEPHERLNAKSLKNNLPIIKFYLK